jgi:hypothetical protein
LATDSEYWRACDAAFSGCKALQVALGIGLGHAQLARDWIWIDDEVM